MIPTKPTKPIARRVASAGEVGVPAGASESGEFLPDEDVIDAASEQPTDVVFAGLSDAPPDGHRFATPPRSEVPPPWLFSAVERNELIRGFVVFFAFLAATVAFVFARTKNVWREPGDESATRTSDPVANGRTLSASSGEMQSAWLAGADVGAVGAEASDAKEDPQTTSDNGHPPETLEAAERSVALDPTDAEGWLVLGNDYERGGKHGYAMRCFENCVRLADHGPRARCAALLR